MARKRKSETVSQVSDKDWQTHSDADALMRAEEVRADKARHSAAQAHLRKKAQHIARTLTPKKAKVSRRKRLESVQL